MSVVMSGQEHVPVVGGAHRVVLHVGLPKTGTTYLQALLSAHRDPLREAGVLFPFVRPGAMFHGAVEVRGSHAKFGLAAEDVAGAWQALCDRARSFPGVSVISHEVLAGASPEEIERALAPLAGLEVHVVVTARDPGRQATAHWQEEVKLGDPRSFADLERDQLRADTWPGDPGRPHFWHAQDFGDALRRWSTAVPAHRVHLVPAPPPGAPAHVLWERFAAALTLDPALDPGLVDPGAVAAANPSLGTLQIAHLRAVNVILGGRLDPGTYNRVVKKGYAEGQLAVQPGERPRTPAALADVLEPAARSWIEAVRAAGHPVHGPLEDLLPVLGAPGDPHPDDVDADDLARLGAEAVARRLLEEASGASRPRPGGPGGPGGPGEGRLRRAAARLTPRRPARRARPGGPGGSGAPDA